MRPPLMGGRIIRVNYESIMFCGYSTVDMRVTELTSTRLKERDLASIRRVR